MSSFCPLEVECLEQRCLLSVGLAGGVPAAHRLPSGWSATAPVEASAGEILGSAWNDADSDGVWDEGELALADFTVYADLNGNGHLDPGDPSSLTDGDGQYALGPLAPGNYLVSGVPAPDWEITYPGPVYGQPQRASAPADASSVGGSQDPSMSADGQLVAFVSGASNLVANDTNGLADVFVWDRSSGAIQRVSVAADGSQANGASQFASMSADGQLVAFVSGASNLVANDTNGFADVFVFHRSSGVIQRVSVATDGSQADGSSSFASISADGLSVAFVSTASNLVPGDTNSQMDVFVVDRPSGTIERVNVAADGSQANGDSHSPALSADGRLVAFASDASNLVAGDTNAQSDVFAVDRQSGTIERVSVAADGAQGAGESAEPAISADGQLVAFTSNSPLVPEDTNGVADVFVFDRLNGTIERVSVTTGGLQGNYASWNPSLSADGQLVVFDSWASNLVSSSVNGGQIDVFVYDRQSGVLEWASQGTDGFDGDGDSQYSALSADGLFVAFVSTASNLVPGSVIASGNVFVRDLPGAATEFVGAADDGTQRDADSWWTSTSSDGRFVAFHSFASNLVPDDTNGKVDVFVYDSHVGSTQRVSVAVDGSQADGWSQYASISGNGRLVAFVSTASNLVPDDTNGITDVFVYDRQLQSIQRVSVADDGSQANGISYAPFLSADGRFVAFPSDASNLVPNDTNGKTDVFVYDRQTGAVELVSTSAAGDPANGDSSYTSLSADGRFVAFHSFASNLVPNDTNLQGDVFVYDRQTQSPERVSVADDGSQANGQSGYASISADGEVVAFHSYASNLVPGDTNRAPDAFVWERQTGAIQRVSVAVDGGQADGGSNYPVIGGADGRYVAFNSHASNLVAGDTNAQADAFVYDRQTQSTERVSVAADGSQANDWSEEARLSADGRFVTYTSAADNLIPGDLNASYDVLLYDRQTTAIRGVSVVPAETPGDGNSVAPSTSHDGRFVAFSSDASNLVPGDTNHYSDVFLYDEQTRAIRRVSVASDGSQADGDSADPAISADGRWVAFSSRASNLVAGDVNGKRDVVLFDSVNRQVQWVSVAPDGSPANGDSATPSVSLDGQFVAFSSAASNLVPGDTNGNTDIFVFDRQSGTVQRVSVGSDDSQANGDSTDPVISPDGQFVVFSSSASNLVADDTNGKIDVFVYDRQTQSIQRVSVAADRSQADGDSTHPVISTDDLVIAYESAATNLVPGDTNGQTDVFVFDRLLGSVQRTSVADDGSQGNAGSHRPSLSRYGRLVAFSSDASDLVPVDTNGATDVFVYDRRSGLLQLASTEADGSQADGGSYFPSISADGKTLLFHSDGSNLTSQDANDSSDVFSTRAVALGRRVAVQGDEPIAGVNFGNHVFGEVAVSIAPATLSFGEGTSGTRPFGFRVGLSGPSDHPVTVTVNTVDGTATAASGDYRAVADTVLTFLPNDPLIEIVTVYVNGDTTVESDETFRVELSDPVGDGVVLGNSSATATIVNDDATVASIAPLTLAHEEGNSGTTPFHFDVSLSRPSDLPVTVTLSTVDGTATSNDGDYSALDGTVLSFFSGSPLTQTITVDVNGDTTAELDEFFHVALTGATGAALGNSLAVGAILNDDSLVIGTEGNDQFTYFNVNGVHAVDVNGSIVVVEHTNEISIDGLGGTDQIVMALLENDERIDLELGHIGVNGLPAYEVDISHANVESVLAISVDGLGNDEAFMFGTPGVDTFVGQDELSVLTGNGYSYTVVGFDSTEADVESPRGGNSAGADVAVLNDTAGPDHFDAFRTYVQMSLDNGTTNTARGFDTAYGVASIGADTVYMEDSDGDDIFTGTDTFGVMTDTERSYVNVAVGFDQGEAHALARSDFDVARAAAPWLATGDWEAVVPLVVSEQVDLSDMGLALGDRISRVEPKPTRWEIYDQIAYNIKRWVPRIRDVLPRTETEDLDDFYSRLALFHELHKLRSERRPDNDADFFNEAEDRLKVRYLS